MGKQDKSERCKAFARTGTGWHFVDDVLHKTPEGQHFICAACKGGKKIGKYYRVVACVERPDVKYRIGRDCLKYLGLTHESGTLTDEDYQRLSIEP